MTAAVLMYQQFEDSKSNEIKSKISKRQHIDIYDNEKRHGLDKYKGESEDEGEDEGIKYVFLLFVTYHPPSQKKLNRPTDLDKRTRSLNYLVYIPKIGQSDNC